jgi:hypothetical protein
VFSDPSAVPETLNLAGPNARITTANAGVEGNQGIISYDLLSGTPEGFEIVLSVEQGVPEVIQPAGDEDFTHFPDFVCASQYVAGDWIDKAFYERWHLQWASVARDIGIESPSGDDQNEFGWGTALSGAYRFQVNPNVAALDRIMFSAAYGHGISRYIADLNYADDTADAVVNAAGELEVLPALAAYVAYTHQWTNTLRSTATISHVNLDNILPLGVTASPYESGEFVAVNLVYHLILSQDEPGTRGKRFYTGLEYLFGQKDALDGSSGEAHRLMYVIALRQ